MRAAVLYCLAARDKGDASEEAWPLPDMFPPLLPSTGVVAAVTHNYDTEWLKTKCMLTIENEVNRPGRAGVGGLPLRSWMTLMLNLPL